MHGNKKSSKYTKRHAQQLVLFEKKKKIKEIGRTAGIKKTRFGVGGWGGGKTHASTKMSDVNKQLVDK